MKTFAWFAVAWGEAVALAVIWVSATAYRNPQANRATAALDAFYRRLSGDPSAHTSAYSRERMLENIWVCSGLALLGILVVIRELVK